MRKFGKMIPFTYLTVDLSNDIKYLPQEVYGPALTFEPSGLLDFVFHALWVLKPCAPR